MLLHPSFVTLIFALSAFGASIKRDVTQVEKDIETLQAKTIELDKSVNDFPNSGGTLAEAMSIHDGAADLWSTIRSTTADITASPAFTDSQSNTIVKQTENLGSAVKKTLSDLVNKKAVLTAINVDPIVLDDLTTLQEDTQDYGTEFIAKVSASMKSTAQEQMQAIDDELEAAVEAYSSD